MGSKALLWNIFGALICLPLMVSGCALFTNGLEWVGKKRRWSHGVVGSVLASVGTALPQTSIPLIAILLFRTQQAKDIGIGAILGAPLVLTTVALALAGGAALLRPRPTRASSPPQTSILRQDLAWFVAAFSIALLSSALRILWQRILAALLLVAAYTLHVKAHFHEFRDEEPDPPLLFLCRALSNPRLRYCAAQAFLGLALILLAAYFFVGRVGAISLSLGLAPALLSLLVSPVASELPEVVNSTLWMRQGKDTLALGNITGAILFQGTILAAIGMSLTPWLLDRRLALSGATSLAAALFAIFALRQRNLPSFLLLSAAFYIAYLLLVVR